MTLELFWYLALILLCAVLMLSKQNHKFYGFIVFLALLIYSLIVRFSGFDVDFRQYSMALEGKALNTFFQFYSAREWLYWASASLLYSVVKSKEITFTLIDLVLIALVFKIRKNFDLPYYFILLFFIFFPSVMGMQNIYRQFIATVLICLAISLKTKKIKWLVLCSAVFIHNFSFLFMPLGFVHRNQIRKEKYNILFFIAATAFMVMLPSLKNYKSYGDPGLQLGTAFVILLFIILAGILMSNQLIIKGTMIPYFWEGTYICFFSLACFLILSSFQTARVALAGLQLLLPVIVLNIESRFVQKRMLRLVLLVLAVAPTFIFENAFVFLLTSRQL